LDAASRDQIRELNESNWHRMEAKFDAFSERMGHQLEAFRAELMKWMFLFWIGTVGLIAVLTGR